ncbi:MAG: hypothetical protein U0R23_10655 [Candidatus Nanopelagicales bacterium]
MRLASVIAGSAVLAVAISAPATAADKVPVKLKIKGCDGCSISATWSKTGKVTGKYRSKTKKAGGSSDTLKFMVPKGYYLYFAGTSPKAQVDAASILVTQFVGQSTGSTVSPAKAQTLNDGASYCLIARKRTVKARAALVPSGQRPLLALWANPQLKALGTKAEDGIKGVYGTQNTLPCAGQYY